MANLLLASVDALPNLGGVSLMTHHLANAIVKQGHRVFLVCGKPSLHPSWPALYEVIEDQEAKPQIREGQAWETEQSPRLNDFFSRVLKEQCIDHAFATHCFYYAPPLQAASRELEIPFSVLIHGFELRSQLTLSQRWRSVRMRQNGHTPSLSDVTVSLLGDADEILANSSYTKGLIESVVTRRPPKVIGCGIESAKLESSWEMNPDQASDRRAQVLAKLSIPVNASVIGTVCRLVPNKNVALLIRSLAKLPNTYAIIIGDGPQKGTLQTLSADLGVAQRVRFMGHVTEEEKWEGLCALDVFCLLSRKGRNGEVEGFGIAMLEAGAAGCAVLSSGIGGMIDVVEHERTGIISSTKSPAKLARILLTLLGDSEKRNRLTNSLRNRIRDKYTWETIAANLCAQWFEE